MAPMLGGTTDMDSTQHHEQPGAANIEAPNGESDESSVPPGAFWRRPTIDELAARQGIAVPQPLDQLIGAAADLWDDDGDFDRFVQGIHDRRREKRVAAEGER